MEILRFCIFAERFVLATGAANSVCRNRMTAGEHSVANKNE